MQRNRLPKKVTTDTQLREWGIKNIPGFIDVISRSEFSGIYPRMAAGDSVIINLDPGYKSGGTHWVALRVSSEAPLVYYKDSFGAPPTIDVSRVITDRGLIYGNRIYQKIRETDCGRRAAEFLYGLARAATEGREIEYFKASE